MAQELTEIVYVCQTKNCGNKQTLRYWPGEQVLPATCCVKCRAGFGTNASIGEMAMHGVGMLPVSQ